MAITQDSLDLAFGEHGGLETVGTLTLRMLPVTAGDAGPVSSLSIVRPNTF